MTNAERIRLMNDDELASWLSTMCQFESEEDEEWHVSFLDEHGKETEIHDSYGDWLNWLTQEAV